MVFCKECGKIIWFWQKTFGGKEECHKKCDYEKFCKELDDLVLMGYYDYMEAERQKNLRLTTYF